MSDESVDAQTETNTEVTPDGGSDLIPRSEAEKAFRARDKAKQEYKALADKLAEYEAAQEQIAKEAAAAGDLSKQLELERKAREKAEAHAAELDGLIRQEKAAARKTKIESTLLSHVPSPDDHKAVLAMFAGMASTLDDGEADAEAVSKAALKELKRLAPKLFEAEKPQPTRGVFPLSGAGAPVQTFNGVQLKRMPGSRK